MLDQITITGGLTGATVTVASTTRPPILFVHGMFGGAWMFADWQRRFAELGYSSLAVNLRGHWGSRPVPEIGKVSVREYVDDALAAAATLGRPIVVGHSMGGLIAQKLAELDAVCAAALLCAAPPRGITVASPSLLVRQLKHAPAVLLSRPLMPDRRDAEALMFNRVPSAEHEALLARMVPESGRAGRELSLGMIAVDERRVRAPVLSVTALDDRFVVPRVGRAIARKYGAEAMELAEHAHYLLAEPGWERVADAVAAWLERAPAIDARTAPAAAPPR
jgi:pimeloyl-ACP methyl ester carboxylesterase